MKFQYLNDTGRVVSIHPATFSHGTTCDHETIRHNDLATFTLPEGTYPWVKMWDYGEKHGLQIFVSPQKDNE
ncbi:hypothetical protein IMZ31_19270 (plasmid) [Pontibacillus sp. ALD_SL1]|uniref:hypothetical protein n=1 Tax=Pontibacillus sp. ALD_SL1 TaxID=2777185 RepID=UPI001A96D65D|nr:hypothetical protein [Pontibacillus sp. ALD_SL1]QST02691.1 hypothetical protein IMZ31_19270 [Pontibacillus sp. ALD_SL1]